MDRACRVKLVLFGAFVLVFSAFGLGVEIVSAQAADKFGAAAVSSSEQADIIDSISQALNEKYIFADVALNIEKQLRKNFKKGKYKELGTVGEFLNAINEDFEEVSHDGHLGVQGMPAENYASMFDENPEEQEEYRLRRLEKSRRNNYGFKKLEILTGNIGYLDLRGFWSASIGGATAVAAMNFLANSDALIFDLRDNGGGDPSMIQLLTSYLLEEPTHLNSFYFRAGDSTQQYWTGAHVEGPRMVETPVYVLTNSKTYSASEEFSYNLKNLKRGIIVGETTGGGAHPAESGFFKISEEVFFEIRIPSGRAINPITKTNWEGTGVEPDIKVPAGQALDAAMLDALKKIVGNSDDEKRINGLQWSIRGLEVKMNPLALEEKSEELYVGTFGPRVITFEDGSLYYQRDGGTKYLLIPMGNDLFGLEDLDYFRIQFVRDSNDLVNELVGTYQGGHMDSNVRTSN